MYENLNRYNPYALYHFGILGMKWGKRNGPPYPLNSRQRSSSEKNTGGKKSTLGKRNEELYGRSSSKSKNTTKSSPKKQTSKSSKSGLTDGQKKVIKTLATTAAIGFAAYGAYKIYENGGFNSLSKAGSSTVDHIFQNESFASTPIDSVKFDPEFMASKVKETAKETAGPTITEQARKIAAATGLRLKDKAMTSLEDAQMVNPKRGTDQHFSKNCGYTVMAWALRKMGLDVQVRDDGGTLSDIMDVRQFFKGATAPTVRVDKTSPASIVKSITSKIDEKFGIDEGAYGMICMEYSGLWGNDGSHWFAWERQNGKIRFIDPQSGGKLSPTKFCFEPIVHGFVKDEIKVSRLDNLEVIPDKLMDQFENVAR